MQIFDFLAEPLGFIMRFIYEHLSFGNYGFSIIIFTVFTRLILFPLNLKQIRSTAKMQTINPKLEELRKKYGTDRQRLNEETMKLYSQEKINPMSSCLPMLVQLPIIMTLFRIINSPLRFLLEKTSAQIEALTEIYRAYHAIEGARAVQEIDVLNFFKASPARMAEVSDILNPHEMIDFGFLGLDLSRTPTFVPGVIFGEEMSIFLPLLLVPVIGVAVAYFTTKISMAFSAGTATASNPQMANMNKTMMYMGPLMTLIFSFQMPAGVLVYWIAGYLIQMVQQIIVNKYILKIKKPGKPEPVDPEDLSTHVGKRRRKMRAEAEAQATQGGPQATQGGPQATIEGAPEGQGEAGFPVGASDADIPDDGVAASGKADLPGAGGGGAGSGDEGGSGEGSGGEGGSGTGAQRAQGAQGARGAQSSKGKKGKKGKKATAGPQAYLGSMQRQQQQVSRATMQATHKEGPTTQVDGLGPQAGGDANQPYGGQPVQQADSPTQQGGQGPQYSSEGTAAGQADTERQGSKGLNTQKNYGSTKKKRKV